MANEARIRQVVDTILNDPDSFDMQNWAEKTSCGTTMCIAGHTVHNEGYQMVFRPEWGITSECTKDGETMLIDALAKELLDLSEEEVIQLFLGMFWCQDENFVTNHLRHENVRGMVLHYHDKATIRQVIENITKVTGFEFKIPDHIV